MAGGEGKKHIDFGHIYGMTMKSADDSYKMVGYD
jgi:hypothetical protein